MSRKQADLLFSLALLLVMIGMVWLARDWPMKSRLFPFTIGLPAILLALLQVGFALRHLREGAAVLDEPATETVERPTAPGSPRAGVEAAVEEMLAATEETRAMPQSEIRLRAIQMCGWLLLFALGAAFLGFRLGSALLTLAFLKVTAQEPWRISILVSLATYLVFAFFFDFALSVHLPPGIVADWLALPSLDAYVIGLFIRR